jgi:hypothetical protein
MFLNGFDISLLHQEDFMAANNSFVKMFNKINIDLVTCRSNLHAFSEGRIPWHYAHGPALLAPALGLGALFSKFYIASSLGYRDLAPISSSPITDYLFSTETMEFIHYGANQVKPYKLDAFAGWQAAHENLRVCFNQHGRHGVQNCGRCFKCIRTVINLKMIGAEGFKTLPSKLTFLNMLRWALQNNKHGPWAQEMIRYAIDRRKFSYLPIYWLAIFFAEIKEWMRRLMPRWFFLWLRNRLYPPHKNPFLHSTIMRKRDSSDDYSST